MISPLTVAPEQPTAHAAECNSCRTFRISDLADLWAKETGRNRTEILEQFVQDFFDGVFERGGAADTLAEAVNERTAGRSPIQIRRDDLWPHIRCAFLRQGLTQVDAATVSIRDWERMGDDGRIVKRLVEGLRLTQHVFHRWYRTAHLPEKPRLWVSREVDSLAENSTGEATSWMPADCAPLQRASDNTIRATIAAVYDHAEAMGMKPPNVKEIGQPVRKRLERQGLTATDNQIQSLAAAPLFSARQLKVGVRAGKFRPFSDLEI